MFQRTYTVKGEYVNDFMVMQNFGYLKYASKIVETFLFVNGFSSLKMNTLKVGLQKNNDQIIHYQNLMFTQTFSVQLEFKTLGYCAQKMNVEVHFYNDKKEKCATIKRELYWFDYNSWTTIIPPKNISKYFLQQKESYKRVG
ncbi:thioesterase family protein [Polaribacter sp. Z022]|uniref:thioesterase family protein n=1 Tax=Polaribacter sp. Z022 TaxID=2927125 RepID=UPI002020E698|nr:thioesterase family protein [Polaribacter sp. Z022]MCL7754651.1 thioesterase family protein [Polaribacter sp. Z022]